MPRVHHVNKARKDNPVAKRGESYYWWKFRTSSKNYSLTPPTRSQLTQSEYLTVIYSCQDGWEKIDDPHDIVAADWDSTAITSWLGQIRDSMEAVGHELHELVDLYEERASNMEEFFDGAEMVERLRECGMACEETCERIDEMCTSVEDSISDLENFVGAVDDTPQDVQEHEQGILDDIDFEEPNFDFHDL